MIIIIIAISLRPSTSPVNAQAEIGNDTLFPEVNDTIRALAVQPDGKILVGGHFTLRWLAVAS